MNYVIFKAVPVRGFTRVVGGKYQLVHPFEREGQHSQKVYEVEGLRFVQPERAVRQEEVVFVDVEKFDREWSKDEEFYITPEGKGQIGNRIERFKEFLQTNKPIEMPEVSGRPDPMGRKSHIGFTNGRHRFVVLRDMGLKTFPVSVSRESADYIRNNFSPDNFQKPRWIDWKKAIKDLTFSQEPNKSGAAYEIGRNLTRGQAIEVWVEYKRRVKESPYGELEDILDSSEPLTKEMKQKMQEFANRSFETQLHREVVEGYLGLTGMQALTSDEIDEKLKMGKSMNYVVLEKADFYRRTRFGKQELVRKPRRWKVTFGDGKIVYIPAKSSVEAIREAKKQYNFMVQRVEDQGEER